MGGFHRFGDLQPVQLAGIDAPAFAHLPYQGLLVGEGPRPPAELDAVAAYR
ncbi:MAG: hypothetical protein ABIN96_07215 [Rubrivivax sp.]